MDEVLLPYLQATSEAEKQQCLDELLLVHASPVVRNTLRERLGIHVSLAGSPSRHQEAEDLYHEILAKIVELLRELDASSERVNIGSFRRYVGRLATNACHDYLRRKSPARARLKNNLRDLLSRHPDFALWRVDEDWFAGFAKQSATEVISARQQLEIEARLDTFRPQSFAGKDLQHLPLSRLVSELLQWLGAAVELNLFVNLVARLLGVKDHPPESLDDEGRRYFEARLRETTLSSDLRLDAKDTLKRLWAAVQSLPPKQRDTFCFSFTDQTGDDLFTLLVDAEIANLQEIALALERSESELAELWTLMPLDRTAIAVELKATPPQVSKWRFRAVERLERDMFPTKKH